jgi:hypothetical protein
LDEISKTTGASFWYHLEACTDPDLVIPVLNSLGNIACTVEECQCMHLRGSEDLPIEGNIMICLHSCKWCLLVGHTFSSREGAGGVTLVEKVQTDTI